MKESLLDAVCTQYLSSRDFNGLLMTSDDLSNRDEAMEGVRAGLIQVVSEADFPNPHIRPWPPRRSIEAQIESLEQLSQDGYGVCLYPTPEAMQDRVAGLYPDEPYRLAMAKGRGTLELAYFDFAVLEEYRNEPKFTFDFGDFGAKAIISDAAYEDESEPEHDKIIMGHIGFAYDLREYSRDESDSPISRRVCAFYGDLAKLSPRHQQRWRTYQVEDETGLDPHPIWIAGQMGHWADGIGPFDLLFEQLRALNVLSERAFDEPLFATAERPADFGWILRPTQREWDAFVVALDKLLSDNLRSAALDAAQAPTHDNQGQRLGTLARLDRLMQKRGVDPEVVAGIMGPLREVRRARQAPSHALRVNLTNATFVHRQVALLEEVNRSLTGLRYFLKGHPANADYVEGQYLQAGATTLRM